MANRQKNFLPLKTAVADGPWPAWSKEGTLQKNTFPGSVGDARVWGTTTITDSLGGLFSTQRVKLYPKHTHTRTTSHTLGLTTHKVRWENRQNKFDHFAHASSSCPQCRTRLFSRAPEATVKVFPLQQPCIAASQYSTLTYDLNRNLRVCVERDRSRNREKARVCSGIENSRKKVPFRLPACVSTSLPKTKTKQNHFVAIAQAWEMGSRGG